MSSESPAISRLQSLHLTSVLGIPEDDELQEPSNSNNEERSEEVEESEHDLEMARNWKKVLEMTNFPLNLSNGSPGSWSLGVPSNGSSIPSSLHRRSNSDVVLGLQETGDEDLGNNLRKAHSVSYNSSHKLSSSTATLESLFASSALEPQGDSQVTSKRSLSKYTKGSEGEPSLFSALGPMRNSSRLSGGLSPLNRIKNNKSSPLTFTLQDSKQSNSTGPNSPRDRPPLPRDHSGSLRGKFNTPKINVPLNIQDSPENSPREPSPGVKERSPATTPNSQITPKLKSFSRRRDWHKLSMDNRQAEELLRRVRCPSVKDEESLKSQLRKPVVYGDAVLGLGTSENDEEVGGQQEAKAETEVEAEVKVEVEVELVPKVDTFGANSTFGKELPTFSQALHAIEDYELEVINEKVSEENESQLKEETSKEETNEAMTVWQKSKVRQMIEKQPVTMIEIDAMIAEAMKPKKPIPKSPEKSDESLRSSNSGKANSKGKVPEPPPKDPVLTPEDPELKAAVEAVENSSDFGPLFSAADGAPLERVREVLAIIRALTRIREAIEYRLKMGESQGISFLLNCLDLNDPKLVEHVVTILLNLSLEEEVKDEIFAQCFPQKLVWVLRNGSQVAKENAAATLYLLTNAEERQTAVGEIPDAIPALLDLLREGQLRGKKDASLALFNLALKGSNRKIIIAKEGVELFLEILERGADIGLEEKILALLEKMVKEQEGRVKIVLFQDGLSLLVEQMESPSEYCRTAAVSTLLMLAKKDPDFESMIEQEAPRPALHKLSQSKSERLQKKVQFSSHVVL